MKLQRSSRWRSVVVVMVVCSVAVGCSGSNEADVREEEQPVATDPSDTSTSEPAVPDELVSRALETLGIDRDRLQIDDPVVLSPSECRLVHVWDIEALDGGTVPYIVQADASVVGRGDATVGEILDSCVFGGGMASADAQPLARMILAMDDTPADLVVASDVKARRFEAAGATFVEPMVTESAGVTTLRFFAYERSFGDLYEVTVERSSDGDVAVDYESLTG